MPLPLLAAALPYVAKGVGALIGANQARQDKKGADAAAARATEEANRRYAEMSPFRSLAQQTLFNRGAPDFSADYAGAPTYQPLSDPMSAQGFADQAKTMAGLAKGPEGPDRMALIRQALADLDAENAPRLKAGIRGIGQDAARLGRLGSGMVTTSIGDLASDVERDRQTKSNELVRQMTEANVNDQFRRQDNQFRLADLQGRTAESAYGRAAGERDLQNELAFRKIGLNNERRRAELAAQAQQFGRGMDLAGLGYGGNEIGDAAKWQAGRLDQQAADNTSAVGDIASSLGDLWANRGGGAPKFTSRGVLGVRDIQLGRAPRPVSGIPVKQKTPWQAGVL